MKIIKVKSNKTKQQLKDLDHGQVFKYPRGEAVYQVCNPVGNLLGLYDVGVVSGNTKVWTVNLANGNTTAVDDDKIVVSCKASLQWVEN